MDNKTKFDLLRKSNQVDSSFTGQHTNYKNNTQHVSLE